MERVAQLSPSNKKLIVLVGVVLALLLVAICSVAFLLIRSKLAPPPAEPQVVQPQIPLPTQVTPLAPAVTEVVYVPIIENSVEPQAAAVQTPVVWRFISINKEDIGTFENASDPNQQLKAVCIDTKRPAPDRGELYTLDGSGILRLQDGSKKYQRFELLPQD